MPNSNPHDDFFGIAMNRIMEIHSKKAHDYTAIEEEFGNFEFSARHAGVTTAQAIEVLIGTKEARRQNLENRIKDAPLNESIEDTLLDRAVYGIIRYAQYLSMKHDETTVDSPTGRSRT